MVQDKAEYLLRRPEVERDLPSDIGAAMIIPELETDAALQLQARYREPERAGGWIARACAIRRSEEHTSELQSLMRSSYAVFCLKKNKIRRNTRTDKQLIRHNTRQDDQDSL